MLVGLALVAGAAVAMSQSHGAVAADGDVVLTPGWNLVGWPGADMPVADALAGGGNIASRVNAVWGYNAGTWHAYFPAAAAIPGANDLTAFTHLAGYFISLNGSDNVTWHIGAISGSPTTPSATPTTAPTQTPTVTPTATPTRNTEPVYADHTTYHTDSIGSVWVVGEVHNTLTVPVEFVEVTANFYDGATLVDTETGYASLTAIGPGGTSPFTVLNVDPPAFDTVKYGITDYDTGNYESVVTGLDATITSTHTDSINYIHTVGAVTNNSAQTYEFVEVNIASYDAAGDVISVDTSFAHPDTLGPGASGTFEVLTDSDDLGASVARRQVFVTGDLE